MMSEVPLTHSLFPLSPVRMLLLQSFVLGIRDTEMQMKVFPVFHIVE